MLTFLNKYARNYSFSQNGEEGILLECVQRLNIVEGSAVEIGANDGLFCSNTALLIKEHGWFGRMVETDYNLWKECCQVWKEHPKVKCSCSHVDGNNINAFVDDTCDVLSLDTDGSDYQIFKGLKVKPKIVIVEIDSGISPEIEGFNADGGASYRTMVELAHEKGYRLLCHTGNLVLIANEYKRLFPEIQGKHPLIESELYFNRAWLKEAA
jgi:hypothetical protein